MHQATVTFRLAIKVVHDGRHIILTGSSSRQLYKEMADNQQKEGAQPKEDAGEKSPATVTICSHHCSHPYCACCPAKPPPDGGGDRPFADSVANAHFALPPFEERLSKWIVDKIVQDKGAKLNCNLEDFISKSNEKEKRLILLLCDQFVKHFKITHYVSTIELGALEYSVFSETEFNSSIGGGGVLGVEKIATLSVSGNRSSHRFRKASEVKMIGKISDGKVGRGTHDEAVVGVRVQPIHTLVKKIPYLQVALQWSLNNYIDEQRDISSELTLLKGFVSVHTFKCYKTELNHRAHCERFLF